MSTRGRGRGSGVQSNDRSSSSSSAASSRSSSLTRPTSSTTIQDPDRLMKQLKTQLGAGSTTATGLSASARPTPKFMPNLATSKKDNKDKTDSTNNNNSASGSNNDLSSMNEKNSINGRKSQTSRGRGGNHRGGHDRGNYIQTEGIFQGNAQIPVAPTISSSSSSSRMSSVKRESSTPNTKLLNIKKLGTAKTTLIGDVDGLKYEIDEENEPRLIPLAQRKSIFDIKKEPDMTKKSKESISTTSEHIDSFVQLFSQQKIDPSTKSAIKVEPMEPTNIPKSQESINDPTQLILMQFPDVLPCIRASSSSSTTTKPELASLNDLPDGFLGKLQIYKSGKCRLKLNDDTYLDVDIGQPTSFLQNVMVTEMAATNINDEHGTNNDMNKLICLGDIKHKLIVSLDAEHVLHDTRQ
ncbi:unnamed protein product [Rotaria sordida]|uniref:DNA-directed RNA polymerase III subunit RPC4 n=1 Tax=Rotaria sordida TaxID=392033 RepID=A0A818JMM7_9BILA|nr:unnamed protein product [Rotaria sordida]CAF3543500.1 unnamed protein product [Rotaria sordida]